MKFSTAASGTFFAVTVAMGAITSPALAADATQQSQSATTEDAVTDTWITTKVKATLASTKGVDSTDISVETNNGIVTLTGIVPTHIEIKKANAAAASIKGVKKVDDSGLKSKD